MKSLVKKISKHALDKMLDQYKKLADMDDSDECTGLFQTSIGVPCRHEIKRRIEENRRFNIDDIHCQWHLHAPPAVLPVAVRVRAIFVSKEEFNAIYQPKIVRSRR
ncbi:hypothetical protein BASA81_014062 [Batrachochytrium salamandrivorans]|nr:hypothetical protein BASA81_014062 [Batrachochytrium salamandrivorans]